MAFGKWRKWGITLIVLAMLTFITGVIGLAVLGASGGSQLAIKAMGAPSPVASGDIPPRIFSLCVQGSAKYSPDIPWHVVCGVTSVESDHGRLQAPGVTSGVNSFGCCAGIAQFSLVLPGGGLGPYRLRSNETNSSTWGAFSVDGDGDGWKDVHDPDDAVLAAARYLQHGTTASGNPCPDVRIGNYGPKIVRALYNYNHACWYVTMVLQKAMTYSTLMPSRSIFLPGTNLRPNSQGYVQMPDSRNGAWRFTYGACQAQRYGKPQLLRVLIVVAQRWKQLHPQGWLWIGDLNASGHKSHNWGVAVDLSATTNGSDWVANYSSGSYNREATVHLGQLFLETGMVKNIWYDDAIVGLTLLRYAQRRGLGNPTVARIGGHDDHFHVDITGPHGPWSTPSC